MINVSKLVGRAKLIRDIKIKAAEEEFQKTLESIQAVSHLSKIEYEIKSDLKLKAPDVIRDVFKDLPEEFGLREIMEAIGKKFIGDAVPTRAMISSALHKMKKRGELELVRSGSGSLSSRYKIPPKV